MYHFVLFVENTFLSAKHIYRTLYKNKFTRHSKLIVNSIADSKKKKFSGSVTDFLYEYGSDLSPANTKPTFPPNPNIYIYIYMALKIRNDIGLWKYWHYRSGSVRIKFWNRQKWSGSVLIKFWTRQKWSGSVLIKFWARQKWSGSVLIKFWTRQKWSGSVDNMFSVKRCNHCAGIYLREWFQCSPRLK